MNNTTLRDLVIGIATTIVMMAAPVDAAQVFPSERENADLIQFLLGMDFVVEGAITGDLSIDTNTVVFPINIGRVIVGTVADSSILLNTLAKASWPPNTIRSGAHVIAYGMRDVLTGSPHSGGILIIDGDGGLIDHRNRGGSKRAFGIGEKPISAAGSFDRTVASLIDQRERNAVEWLGTGSGMALVVVAGVSYANHAATLKLLAWVAGLSQQTPALLTWPDRCVSPEVGDTLVVPVASAGSDSIAGKSCLQRLRVYGRRVPALGLDVTDIRRGFETTSDGRLRLRHIQRKTTQ